MPWRAGTKGRPPPTRPTMFQNRVTTASRPSWQINLFAVALVLLTSTALLWILRDGPPNRLETTAILAALTLTPVVMRWQAGWLTLFLLLPWIAWIRRMALYWDPSVAAIEANDFTLLLPDAIAAITISGFLLTRHMRRREAEDPGERLLVRPIAFFIGLCAVEVFNPFMASVPAGLNGWRIFVLYIGLYWVTREVAKARGGVTSFVVVSVLFAAATGLYGAWQYLVGFPAHELQWAESNPAKYQIIGESMRAFSTFSFTSTFSHFMIIGACMSWAAMRLDAVGRLMRLLAPIALLLCLTGMAVTFVRSSFLGLILAGIATVVIAGDPAWRLRRLVLVLVVGIGALVLMPSSGGDAQAYDEPTGTGALVADRLMSMRDPTSVGSFNLRLDTWQRTVTNITLIYPLGVGIGAGAATRFGGNGFAAALAYSESQYVSLLAETGWPGFLLFCWITGYGLYFSVRTYDELRDPQRKRLVLMAFGIQLGLLTTGVTGGPVLYTQPGCAYYWTALGLVAAMRRAEAAERGERTLGEPAPVSATAP